LTTDRDFDHDSRSCSRCDGGEQCSGCGHFRDDVDDFGPSWYCTDCELAITRWREAEQDLRWFEERGLLNGESP
jgi:hypothetical protein